MGETIIFTKKTTSKGGLEFTWARQVNAIRNDALIRGMNNEELWAKYEKRVLDVPNRKSFRDRLALAGIARARKMVKKKENVVTKSKLMEVKKRVAEKVEKELERKLTPTVSEKIAKKILDRQMKGADKHFDRMEGELDRSHEVLSKRKLNQKNVGFHLMDLQRFDDLGRKLYNIGQQTQLGDHQAQVTMLIFGDQFIQEKDEEDVMEAELVSNAE